jgi:hypothetical protein
MFGIDGLSRAEFATTPTLDGSVVRTNDLAALGAFAFPASLSPWEWSQWFQTNGKVKLSGLLLVNHAVSRTVLAVLVTLSEIPKSLMCF